MKKPLFLIIFCLLAGVVHAQCFRLIAGKTDQTGNDDGTGSAATLDIERGMAFDSQGNLYFRNAGAAIRKVTPEGVVTTLAGDSDGSGNVDGVGGDARFGWISDVLMGGNDTLYVTDEGNHTIRKVALDGTVITWLGSGTDGDADGTGTAASFNTPTGITRDPEGNFYICDYFNHRIRKVTPAGVVTTLAGSTEGYQDGVGGDARFSEVFFIVYNPVDGFLYTTECGNPVIRKINRNTGEVVTFAGNAGESGDTDGGPGVARIGGCPYNIAADQWGNLYVSDNDNNAVRKIDLAGNVSTVFKGTGSDVFGGNPDMETPWGIAVDTTQDSLRLIINVNMRYIAEYRQAATGEWST
ncbi:MAG: hypothetical protein KF690_03650 [Bacteroidetes bacterium]|nr:hypothetical protein [Bacteroidota bacterium]